MTYWLRYAEGCGRDQDSSVAISFLKRKDIKKKKKMIVIKNI